MILDRTTYEAWLLDRIEGKLTRAQEQDLDAFLAAHPDLDPGTGDLPSITDAGEGFAWKAELKKQFPPSGHPDAARIDDFLIARLEGELDAVQVIQLDRLLYEQSELLRNAKLIEATKSSVPVEMFPDKSSIARHFPPLGLPDAHRLDDFLVARMEGDLTLQQRVALDALISTDAHAAKQWATMQHARVPQERVVFAGKEHLKKRAVRVFPIMGRSWMKLAAAASIALVLGLGWLLLRNGDTKPVVAESMEQGQEQEQEQEQGQGQGQEQEQEHEQEQGQQSTEKEKASVPERKEQTDQGQGPWIGRHQDQKVLVPRQRDDAPAMADVQRSLPQRNDEPKHPVRVDVPQGLPPATFGEALAVATTTPEHQTIGELFAGTVRTEVLGQQPTAARVLDGNDAMAAIDKGLGAISGDCAGLVVQRDRKRDRFRLRLGDLALSASRGR